MTETSTAFVATEHGSRYLQQLCKHFAHKIPVEFDPDKGRISFDAGPCLLEASATGLKLMVEAADAETCARLEDVVARHLVRFAFREEMVIAWTKP